MESQLSRCERLRTMQGHISSHMSSSLRERLKKCGRYHPSTPITCTGISDATHTHAADASRSDLAGSVIEPKVDLPAASGAKPETATPKRRPLKLMEGTNFKDHSQFIKRKKICQDDCSGVRPESKSGSVTVSCLQCSSLSKEKESVEGTACCLQSTNSSKEKESVEGKQACKTFSVTSSAKCNNTNLCSFPDDSVHDLDIDHDNKCVDLRAQKAYLEAELKNKEEQLRKLKLVKMYREKNDLTELQELINTWRDVSQRALVDLLDHHAPPKPTMTALISHLQIDHELISYDADEESFS